MANITFTTDGTLKNTTLTVDGKNISKKDKVVNIDIYAAAPYKSSYSGEIYKGGVGITYTVMGDDGTFERKTYGSTDTDYVRGIGQKVKTEDQVVRFVGQDVDVEISNLVDKITSHCKEKGIPCPDKDTLMSRSKESLLDKVQDLEINIED